METSKKPLKCDRCQSDEVSAIVGCKPMCDRCCDELNITDLESLADFDGRKSLIDFAGL